MRIFLQIPYLNMIQIRGPPQKAGAMSGLRAATHRNPPSTEPHPQILLSETPFRLARGIIIGVWMPFPNWFTNEQKPFCKKLNFSLDFWERPNYV